MAAHAEEITLKSGTYVDGPTIALGNIAIVAGADAELLKAIVKRNQGTSAEKQEREMRFGSSGSAPKDRTFSATGNPLDLAIDGEGFFQVLLPDGTIAFTRDGSFRLSDSGDVVTAGGYLLVPAISIPEDAQNISVSQGGAVSFKQPGAIASTAAGNIEPVLFDNPSALENQSDKNLLFETEASGGPVASEPGTDGVGTLAQGFLEDSMVQMAEEIICIIVDQHAYEAISKVILSADDDDE